MILIRGGSETIECHVVDDGAVDGSAHVQRCTPAEDISARKLLPVVSQVVAIAKAMRVLCSPLASVRGHSGTQAVKPLST